MIGVRMCVENPFKRITKDLHVLRERVSGVGRRCPGLGFEIENGIDYGTGLRLRIGDYVLNAARALLEECRHDRTGQPLRPRVHVLDINRWVAKRSRALADDDKSDSLVQCWEKGTDLDCFVEPLPSGTPPPFVVYNGPTITFPDGHYPVETIATQSGFSLMVSSGLQCLIVS